MYDHGARNRNPVSTLWYGIDPLWEKYPDFSPYNYCVGNPVKLVDPDGEKTIVKQNEDGTYQVIGGEIDGDNGIYLNDKIIAYSATPYSFTPDGQNFIGKIDPNDGSGQFFLNKVIQDKNMTLDYYMNHAKGQQLLDFKRTNGTSTDVIYNSTEDYYRGMPINLTGDNKTLPVYASARDTGNIGAGFMAGSRDIPWLAARWKFDQLQTRQDIDSGMDVFWSFECFSTKFAEKLGHRIGKQCHDLNVLNRLPSYNGLVPSHSIITTNDYSPW